MNSTKQYPKEFLDVCTKFLERKKLPLEYLPYFIDVIEDVASVTPDSPISIMTLFVAHYRGFYDGVQRLGLETDEQYLEFINKKREEFYKNKNAVQITN